MPTQEEAHNEAGLVLALGRIEQLAMTPREQAEGASYPGCRNSVDELEARIRARRGLTNPTDTTAPKSA